MKNNFPRQGYSGFTLIELLVVIAIIGVLAGLGLSVTGGVKRQQYLKPARAELDQIATALDNFKAQYGVYPPSNPNLTPALNTLYYELSGVTHNLASQTYTTLDRSYTISDGSYAATFTAGGASIGGIINCTKGSAEDGTAAKDFLPSLRQNRIGTETNGTTLIGILVTSVGGPDQRYMAALAAAGFSGNPFRYVYPGTNNPSSYDLWIDLSISGKTNRISNWTRQPQILP